MRTPRSADTSATRSGWERSASMLRPPRSSGTSGSGPGSRWGAEQGGRPEGSRRTRARRSRGDMRKVRCVTLVEGSHDDLFDPADDELRNDRGRKRPQHAPVDCRADVRLNDADYELIESCQRFARETGAAGHAQDQAGRVRLRKHDLHDLAAACLAEGDAILLRPR